MIVIVDYGMGNLESIRNMLKKANFDSVISGDTTVINDAEKIILPGVGAFDQAMKNINDLSLADTLDRKVLKDKTPILGICLGMQLLANSSEEGGVKGLGWIDADVIKFQFDRAEGLKVPHMGWNRVIAKSGAVLFEGYTEEEIRFYFVHSYYMKLNNNAAAAGSAFYGFEFTCAVQQDNIYGVQFHPEKSHKYGLNLLRNFASL